MWHTINFFFCFCYDFYHIECEICDAIIGLVFFFVVFIVNSAVEHLLNAQKEACIANDFAKFHLKKNYQKRDVKLFNIFFVFHTSSINK